MFNLDEGQMSLKHLATNDTYDSLSQNKFFRRYNTRSRTFKLIER